MLFHFLVHQKLTQVLLKVAVGVAVTPAIAARRRQEAMADPTLVVAAVVVLLTVVAVVLGAKVALAL